MTYEAFQKSMYYIRGYIEAEQYSHVLKYKFWLDEFADKYSWYPDFIHMACVNFTW